MRRGYQSIILAALATFSINAVAVDSAIQLPGSLGKWYKPENKRQVWLHTMFAMRREVQAVQEYADQADLVGVKKWSAKLIKHYRQIPEMVPEWLDEVELDTATELEEIVEAGDFTKIKSVMSDLARSCKGCHKEFRVLAALRYRSADFSDLKIMQAGKEIKFSEFKKGLIRTLNRINISAEDARWETAVAELDVLELKLQAYGTSCASCHKDSEPHERILGAATVAGLAELKQAIENRNQKDTGRRLGATAVDVCARCHGVHRTLSEIRRQLFGAELTR